MLRVGVVFLVIALIAGGFGFGIVGDSTWLVAKIAFYFFLAVAAISLFGSTLRGNSVSLETVRRRQALDSARSRHHARPATHHSP